MKRGWEAKPLGEVCEVMNGGTPKTAVPAYWGGSHLWITPAEMGKRLSPYVDDTERKLSDLGLQESSARILPLNSVILSSRAPIGHLVVNTAPMATNQGCKGLIPRGHLHYKYLYYYLASIVELLNALGTGTTFKELSGGKLKEVTIPVAPLREQHRIVAILDEAFEGIAIAKANAEKNLQNARALIQPAFTAILDLFDRSQWKTSTVEGAAQAEKGSIRTGPFGSQLLHSEFVAEGIPVLGIDNAVQNRFAWSERRYITQQKFSELSRYQVRPGDVLITIMGTCGRCAIVPDDIPVAINSKHLCCITLDRQKCLPEYLHAYFLHHPQAREFLSKQAKGSIMEGLNMGLIKEMPLVLPPVKQQKSIAKKVVEVSEAADRLESIYRQKLAALEALKKSLLHQAFTGNLTSRSA